MTTNESKVGYTTLNKTIQAQLQKDVWLLSNDPSIRYMIWHFYRSPKIGLIGPSKPLMQELEKNGIGVVINH